MSVDIGNPGDKRAKLAAYLRDIVKIEPIWNFRDFVSPAQWDGILSGVMTESLSIPLQQAEDWVHSKGGGCILYPAGVIPINGYKGAQSSYNDGRKGGLYVTGGVHHIGIKGKTVWKNVSDDWRCMARIRQGSDWSFQNITFDGDRYNHPAVALETDDVRGELIIIGDEISAIENAGIIGCHFTNADHYAIGVQNSTIDGLLIEGNTGYDIGGDFLDIKDMVDQPKKRVAVRNNRVGKIGTNWQRRVADGDGAQAAFDLRGPVLFEGNEAFDIDSYHPTQFGNDGIRVNCNVPSQGRRGGARTQLTNNFAFGAKLDGEGTASGAKRTRGLVIQAENCAVANCYVEGFFHGVLVDLGGDPGVAEGEPFNTTITGLHVKRCNGVGSSGMGIRLGAGTSGHQIQGVVENSDIGLSSDAKSSSVNLTLKGNKLGHDVSANTIRQGDYQFQYIDNDTNSAHADDAHSISGTLKVWAEHSARVVVHATRNANDWEVPRIPGGFYFEKSDTSGLGAGVVGGMEYRFAGTSASNGGVWFWTVDGETGPVDVAWFQHEYAQFFKPIILPGDAYVPPTSLSPGKHGQVAFDLDYFYTCVAPDLWRKLAWNPIEYSISGNRREFLDRAAAIGSGVAADCMEIYLQCRNAAVDIAAGGGRWRRAKNDTEYNSVDTSLQLLVSGYKFVPAEPEIDITMAGAHPSLSGTTNFTAITHTLRSAVALGAQASAKVPGTYIVDTTIYCASVSRLTFYIGPFVKVKGTVGLEGKLFDLRGDLIHIHGMGTIDGSLMPNSPVDEEGASLAAWDMLAVIGNRTVIRDLDFYAGENWETAGSDSHIFLAGTDLLVEHTRHKGAKDLAIYITDRTTTPGQESFARVVGSIFDECRDQVAAKRGFANLYVDGIQAKNGKNGVFTGETELVGTTAKYLTVVNSTFEGFEDSSIIARVSDRFKLANNTIRNSIGTNLIQIQGSSYGIVRGNHLEIDPAVYVSPSSQRGILIRSRDHTDGITYHSCHNLIVENIISGIYNPIFEFDANQDWNIYVNNRVYGHSGFGPTGVRKMAPNSKVVLEGAGLDLVVGRNDEPASSNLYITGASGSARRLIFQTAGVDRWHVMADSEVEDGENGSNFEIRRRHASDGSHYSTPISIAHATGIVTIGDALKLPDFTVGTTPSPASRAQCVIYISDGSSNRHLAIADGGNWRWGDGSIVS